MLYLSQILNSKVVDSSDTKVGNVKDVLILQQPGVYSPLKYLLVSNNNRALYVPYEYVENLNEKEVSLSVLSSKIPTERPELGDLIFLNKHVMDQQIVDVEGARVVRVNDLKLGNFEDRMCVLGIDVSTKGLLRRLGVGRLDIFKIFKVKFIDWRKAQTVRGTQLKLDTISKDLIRLHPADLANIIEELSLKQGSRLVKNLDADTAAKVMEEIEPAIKKIVVRYLGPEKAARIIEKMSADEITDLMQMLPRPEAEKFLSYLQSGKMKKVEKLISYDYDTAGGMMNTEFMLAEQDWSVEKTLEEIKKVSPSMRSMLYVYVIDKTGKLKGMVSLRRLITATSERKLKEIMKRLQRGTILRLDQDVDEIVKVMTKYNLYTAAVVDDDNRIVGVVAIDDVMRHLAPKA